jgi:transcriptional regulator GlxA family with amidase domain
MLQDVRHSEFWQLLDDEFGPAYARTVARDVVVDVLGGRTAEQALAAGVRPREVWRALCDAMEVPAERRWGRDPKDRRSTR